MRQPHAFARAIGGVLVAALIATACTTATPVTPAPTAAPTETPAATGTIAPTPVATAVASATAGSATVGPGVTVTPLPPGATPPPAPTPPPGPTATPPPTPTPPTAAGPGVYGLLTVGPTCPVQRVDQPCPDRAYAGTLSFQDAAGREVAGVTAGDDGQYAVALAPGTYHVVPSATGGAMLPRAAPVDVTVAGGGWTRLDVAYDSGIR